MATTPKKPNVQLVILDARVGTEGQEADAVSKQLSETIGSKEVLYCERQLKSPGFWKIILILRG